MYDTSCMIRRFWKEGWKEGWQEGCRYYWLTCWIGYTRRGRRWMLLLLGNSFFMRFLLVDASAAARCFAPWCLLLCGFLHGVLLGSMSWHSRRAGSNKLFFEFPCVKNAARLRGANGSIARNRVQKRLTWRQHTSSKNTRAIVLHEEQPWKDWLCCCYCETDVVVKEH